MKEFVGIIIVALIIVGVMYIIDKAIRSIFGVKKEHKSNIHINELHKNLHTLLIIILFILIFVNNVYNFISNITAVVIFTFSVFTFHSLMQKIFLKESKEHLITFLTGLILTCIVGVTLFIIV